MRFFKYPSLCSILSLVAWALPLAAASSLRSDRSLQSEVVRTDLIRLIPFEVQIAIDDDLNAGESQVIAETLYQGGSLLTDTITDWMIESFVAKTTNEFALGFVNNFTSFDSIALEMVDDTTAMGTIDGEELTVVEVSFAGVSLWDRQGTGTPPMESEIVELIQRATFLEDRNLKNQLQNSVDSLLVDLGVELTTVPPLTVVDVRAYITPPGTSSSTDEDVGENPDQAGSSAQESQETSQTNKNLETIIIVAIVVACLAFALLIFAVIWAWRSDRNEKASSGNKRKSSNKLNKTKSDPSIDGGVNSYNKTVQDAEKVSAPENPPPSSDYQSGNYSEAESSLENPSSYDLPNVESDGSYPRMVGNTNDTVTDDSGVGYPGDSVVSDDIKSSLTDYYKSGMGYSGSRAGSARPASNFNDAASLSSMDSYGYSLDGYAPSLGPAQGGYPVGPMQAARDAPMPLGDEEAVDIQLLQEEESIVDYGK